MRSIRTFVAIAWYDARPPWRKPVTPSLRGLARFVVANVSWDQQTLMKAYRLIEIKALPHRRRSGMDDDRIRNGNPAPCVGASIMLSEAWRSLVRRYIVYDIPDEMAACFDCEVVRCPDDKYEACLKRSALAAELSAAQTAKPTER